MNPLLVSGFGNVIGVDRRRLIVQNKLKSERIEFLPHQINYDSIIVDGHTGSITFEAMRWLMKHDITLTLLNWNGNLLSTTLPQEPKSGKLRIMQYAKHIDSVARHVIAARITDEKIKHTRNLLLELSRYYREIDVHTVTAFFENGRKNYDVTKDKTTGNLMNYEGRIATFYWSMLAQVFNKLQPEFHFVKRRSKSYSWNMNASDEINALLNYGYAILESEIRKAINTVGLDPAVGYLHEVAASKTPLVYDIQELFRWLVDYSVLQMLEEKKLKKADLIVTENYHLRLKEQTAKMLIERIGLNFNGTTHYKGKNHTYQTILRDNIQHLANFILGKQKTLAFDIPAVSIKRDDTLELQERIMSISASDRRRRGINKSTLWYQQRGLAESKKIKVYGNVLDKLRLEAK